MISGVDHENAIRFCQKCPEISKPGPDNRKISFSRSWETNENAKKSRKNRKKIYCIFVIYILQNVSQRSFSLIGALLKFHKKFLTVALRDILGLSFFHEK